MKAPTLAEYDRHLAEFALPADPAARARLIGQCTAELDDIKKNAASAEYVWLMQIVNDLEIKQNSGGQLILGPVGSTNDRRLLVRVLAPGAGAGAWTLESYVVDTTTYKQVKFTLSAVEPAFKVLLYPHRDGDPLPTTALNTSPDEIEVVWTSQADTYDLDLVAGGRTVLSLQP